MIPNSQSYLHLRDQSQQFLDFVVLTCTAVPALTSHINALGVTGLTPDHFKGKPDGNQLLRFSTTYKDQISRAAVITLFSFFEAYVISLLQEIVDFHGGALAFQATADRRAKNFLVTSSPTIIDSKRKLQEPVKKNKIDTYKKHSSALTKQGFRFPSELLAPFGVKVLIQRAKPKGSRAVEIPDLLRDALCFPLTTKDYNRINSIRDLRNKIAHGKTELITLRSALGVGKDLRAIAAKIDQHAVEHFFVLEQFA